MPSIFTKIINGELPCHKVAENEKFFAFMEISPLKPGHVLVIPKKEVDYIFDLDDTLLSELTLFAKKIAVAVKKVVPCEKIALVVYGLMVRHTHMHLIPVDGTPGELEFGKAKRANDSDLASTAQLIRSQL